MKRILLYFFVVGFIAACQTRTPSADSVATAIEETAIMKRNLEPATSTSTQAPTETATTTLTATASPEPTATVPLHPIQLYDDFSSNQINWLDCDVCEWKNDALFMGPYPASGAYKQHFAVCLECGLVTYYRMAVVVRHVDGPSDRGFGFFLRWTEDYIITVEILPWQTVDVYKLDLDTGLWTWLDGNWSGSIKAGKNSNRIEVYVTESSQGATDINVTINGKTLVFVWGQPRDQSPVGLTLWGHALEVSFDDFVFEEYEPYGDPIELEDLDRPSGG